MLIEDVFLQKDLQSKQMVECHHFDCENRYYPVETNIKIMLEEEKRENLCIRNGNIILKTSSFT